jgi:signal transduction histidine kinase
VGRSWVPWNRRSLAPKLFGAFVAVLALSSLATLLVETGLTRAELTEQNEQLARDVAENYRGQLQRESARTAGPFSIFVQQIQIETTDLDRALEDSLTVARRSGPFTLSDAFDVRTGAYRLEPPSRARIVPPEPGSRASQAARRFEGQRRVVPLVDDAGSSGFGLIYTMPFNDLEDGIVVAVGNPLDAGFARQVRDLVGVSDVEVVVEGQRVATTLDQVDGGEPDDAAGSGAPFGDPTDPELQEVAGDRAVQYLKLGVDDGWSVDASVGLLIDDPLAPLDARLSRYRALMVALLLLIGGVIALAFATVMTRPLTRLTHTARAIAGGDLDASFAVSRRDEIGQLADALERMRRALGNQLQVISQQAAALQLAARRVVGSRDRERQRLAQDLHDGIQQQLVVLRMQVGAGRARVRRDPEAIDAVAEGLAGSIDAVLDDLRATAQALYPSILRDRGLGGALPSLAARSAVEIEIVLHPDPLPRLDEDLEANAYFLVCEAVTNAMKHAGEGCRIVVELRADAKALHLEVTDDGRGFEPSEVGHRGLQNLRDRVNALEGTLQVLSAPGEGTSIRALLPRSPGVVPPLEVEEDRSDATVEVELFGEPELAEDRVGVLLDRSFGDGQVPRDRGVPPT